MLGKLFGLNKSENDDKQDDRRELEKVKQRVDKVEKRVTFIETQYTLLRPPEEAR